MVEDLCLAEHPSRVEHEVAEQLELGGRELEQVARARHLVAVLVEREVGEHQHAVRRAVSLDTPQHRAHASDQLVEAERLGHVVVAAEREPADLVLGRITRGQVDRGHRPALAREPAVDLEAIEVGEHHIEHDQVGRERLRVCQRRTTRARRLDLEPLIAKGGCNEVRDRRLVIDDEHALWRAKCAHVTTLLK